MRQIYLQKAFYQLGRHRPVQVTAMAKHCLQLLSAWQALRARGMGGQAAAETVGVSRATLYRWQVRWKALGPKGLETRSRRPKRVRQRTWSPAAIQAVQELRQLYPRWGKEKLAVLAAGEGLHLSASSVGRILNYLLRRGLLQPFHPRRHLSKHRTRKRPYAVRKPKTYGVSSPGDLVQVDTLDIRPFPHLRLKHFTARDVISRWDVLEVHTHASSAHAEQFLDTLLRRMPFPVRAIQVDGGSEFKKQFEQACRRLGLQLFILPPHSPKLNGRVERAHRTHLDEFYAVYDLEFDPPALNPVLQEWERIYNFVRPHRALDNLSPAKYIRLHHPSLSPALSHMY
jgi:transposase InsO family protein